MCLCKRPITLYNFYSYFSLMELETETAINCKTKKIKLLYVLCTLWRTHFIQIATEMLLVVACERA